MRILGHTGSHEYVRVERAEASAMLESLGKKLAQRKEGADKAP